MSRSSSHPVHAFPSLSLIPCARLFILSLLFQYNSPEYFVNALHRPSAFDHIAAFDQPLAIVNYIFRSLFPLYHLPRSFRADTPADSASGHSTGLGCTVCLPGQLLAHGSERCPMVFGASLRAPGSGSPLYAASVSNSLRRGPTYVVCLVTITFL